MREEWEATVSWPSDFPRHEIEKGLRTAQPAPSRGDWARKWTKMLKEINDDDKDENKNPTSNDNLTRFVPVSVTILVLCFYSCGQQI